MGDIQEIMMVGAGIGSGFKHSSELNVIKYNQAMRSNNLDELTKWIKGWMKSMPGSYRTKSGLQY
jgi:hypothetical protein